MEHHGGADPSAVKFPMECTCCLAPTNVDESLDVRVERPEDTPIWIEVPTCFPCQEHGARAVEYRQAASSRTRARRSR
jgi:hypothetical protein